MSDCFNKSILLGGLILGWMATTSAQETPSMVSQKMAPIPPSGGGVRTLTWEDCVALAATKNPSLTSADYSLKANRASYLGSFNGLLPNLTLSDSYAASQPAGRGIPGYSAQYAASVNLFNIGQVANIKTASANYTQAQANLRLTSANLRFSLRQAFAQAYFAEQNITVAEKILDIQQKNADEVILRYQGGKEYKGNMMNAKAQVAQAQSSLDQTLRALRTTRRNLDQQLGLDDFAEVTVTGTLAAQYPPDLPARMEDFLSGRPDVAVQTAVIRQQKAAVTSAESGLYPSLSANYARSRSGAVEFPTPHYGWTAGASLSYPLFGGGPTATYFSVQSAKRSLDKSEQDLRTVRNAAVFDLESAWAAYANAFDQALVAETNLEAARQRNDEAAVRYASGLLSFDNWEVIVGEWVSAEQQAKNAQQNAVIAQAAWEKSLGRALGE